MIKSLRRGRSAGWVPVTCRDGFNTLPVPALCLTRPAVATVLQGAHHEELLECTAFETASGDERDYASAFAAFPKSAGRAIMYSRATARPCPQGIDVASVTKFLNLAQAQQQVPETVR